MDFMATMTLFQQRTNEGPDGYKIKNRVDAAADIPMEVFVVKTIDDTFDHVATIEDFFYPAVKDVEIPYYRVSEVDRLFDNVETAISFASHVKFRVDAVVKAYTPDVSDFVGSESTDFPTP